MPELAIVCLSMGTVSRFGRRRLRDFLSQQRKAEKSLIFGPVVASSFPLFGLVSPSYGQGSPVVTQRQRQFGPILISLELLRAI